MKTVENLYIDKKGALKKIYTDTNVTIQTGNTAVIVESKKGIPLTITLPSVADNVGTIVDINVVYDSNSEDITITDKGDDAEFTDLVLDEEGEFTVLLSDGVRWWEIGSFHA